MMECRMRSVPPLFENACVTVVMGGGGSEDRLHAPFVRLRKCHRRAPARPDRKPACSLDDKARPGNDGGNALKLPYQIDIKQF